MQRIRQNDVEARITQLNLALGRPILAWGVDGANIGNHHLYCANGCYSLHVLTNNGGGVHNLFTGTLREVDTFVRGMLHVALINKPEA